MKKTEVQFVNKETKTKTKTETKEILFFQIIGEKFNVEEIKTYLSKHGGEIQG